MMRIRKCDNCKTYTIQKECPSCKGVAQVAKPPKYSPEDKYGSYRRQAQDEMEDEDE